MEEIHPGPIVAGYESFARSIATACPELVDAQRALVQIARDLLIEVYNSASYRDLTAIEESQNLVLNQFLNDFLDLLYESATGRGRPAMRSARSLFEHAVNFATVTHSSEEAERYAEHEVMMTQAYYSFDYYELGVLDGDELKNLQRKHVHRLRQAEKAAAVARKKFGNGFRRSWASKNLHDRAAGHGFESGYDFYRVASAVMHGSSGGSIGTFGEVESGHRLHRTGPAFGLLPLALAFGVTFADDLLSMMDEGPAVSQTREIIAGIRGSWLNYRDAVYALDDFIRPPDAPLMVLARVNTLFKLNWWVHDRELGRVAKIEEPELDEVSRASVAELLDTLKLQGLTEPVTIAIAVVRAVEVCSDWQSEANIVPNVPIGLEEGPMIWNENASDWESLG